MMTEPRPVLFGMERSWEAALKGSADPLRYSVEMADFATAELSGFAAVVPLSLADHALVMDRGLPALPVSTAMRELCHDKVALNQRLIDLGFGDHVPAMRQRIPDDPAAHPVIVKPRRGAWGIGAEVLLAGPIPAEATQDVALGTRFVQDLVPGRREYAAHVLVHQGAPRFWQSIEYDMGEVPCAKGRIHRPQAQLWLSETPGQSVLQDMLAAIDFDQGTCCINYRMVRGSPVLFEINPRFGGSLAWKVSRYLDIYLECLG